MFPAVNNRQTNAPIGGPTSLAFVSQKATENIKRAQLQQQKYYNAQHKPESFEEGSYVLLSTQNLRMKGTPQKLEIKKTIRWALQSCTMHREPSI